MLAELGLGVIDISAITLSTIGIISMLMVLTGRLVPKKYYDEAVARFAEEQTETRRWRKVAEISLHQNSRLLDKDDVSLTTLQAIRQSIEEQEARP